MRIRRRWQHPRRAVLAAALALGAAAPPITPEGLAPAPSARDRLVAQATQNQANDLAASLALASEAIRRHQRPDGNWPTAVTLGPRFEDAWTESNVFTPAILVDL